MSEPMTAIFVKFFTEEDHADCFLAGNLYLNTLGYFKKKEAEECSDGRSDPTEGVAMWWQPDNLSIKFASGIEITGKDLAAPVSMSFDYHNHLHVFCMYALHITGFECVDDKVEYAPEDEEELRRQLTIDERCFKFGVTAVVIPAAPFLLQLTQALQAQGYGQNSARGELVEYYDGATQHGEFPFKDIPFRKQKRFDYQQEYRLCLFPRSAEEFAVTSPVTVKIGDLRHLCVKGKASELHNFILSPGE
jgi:hypothetical protein